MNLTARTLEEDRIERRPSALLHAVPSPAPAIDETPPCFTLALAELWTRLQAGTCFLRDCRFSPERCYFQLVFRPGEPAPADARSRRALERVLLGESQKVVAFDL